MRKIILLTVSLLLTTAATSSADLINLDWYVSGAGGPAGTFDGATAPVLGSDGDTWNGIDVSYGNIGQSVDTGMLVDSTGVATGVSVQITQIYSAYDLTGNGTYDPTVDPTFQDLMIDYLFLNDTVNSAVITIDGLIPSASYDLVLFGANSAGQPSTFTIGGVSKSTTDLGSIGTTLIEADEYVRFNGLVSNAAGQIVINWTLPGTFAVFNGLQIEGAGFTGPLMNPTPENGADSVLGVNTLLQWWAWPEAIGYNVYLGTDQDAVAFNTDLDGNRKVDLDDLTMIAANWQREVTSSFEEKLDIDHSGAIDIGDISLLASDWLLFDESTFIGSFSAETTTYHTGSLLPNTTYYWRVDEVDDQTVHKGDIWEFKTFKADGLTARIYNNSDLSDLKVTRVDSQINFDWGTGSPDPSVDVDTFSVSWEGGLVVPEKGDYTFYTTSDDGTRLYINDILIIDEWSDHGMAEYSGQIYLRPGSVYPIRMEYYDNGASAAVNLKWSGPGIAKQIVPTEYLTSTLTVNQPKDIWVVDLDSLSMAKRLLTLSLQGLIAKDSPVIMVKQWGLPAFVREDMEAEGTVFHDNTSALWLLNMFSDHIDGLILCGSDLESINAATSLCGPMRAVAVEESILDEIQNRTKLPVLVDVRGLTELDIYNTYRDLFGHETMVDVNKVDFLRDISITRNAFTYYNVDSTTRKQFISGLTSQATILGWGSNAEYDWVKDISQENAGGVPADWCRNLSILSKLRIDIPKPPRRYPAPVQEGERIVAFSMSDGDNLQIMAGGAIDSPTYFAHPARGTFPMTWEFPPSMGELNPRGVRSFYGKATTGDNLDCFIAGPSGHAYAFHCYLTDPRGYAKNTAQAMQKCQLTVASMINDNGGSMSDADELLERPEIMGVAYKDWAPYNRRGGEIYWHNGKPAVSYKCILWDGLGSPEEVAAEIEAMPSSPATNSASYAMINANAWSFGDIGGPMQAIVNTIDLLPPNTRIVTVEELIILLRNNFGDPITEEEYDAM